MFVAALDPDLPPPPMPPEAPVSNGDPIKPKGILKTRTEVKPKSILKVKKEDTTSGEGKSLVITEWRLCL